MPSVCRSNSVGSPGKVTLYEAVDGLTFRGATNGAKRLIGDFNPVGLKNRSEGIRDLSGVENGCPRHIEDGQSDFFHEDARGSIFWEKERGASLNPGDLLESHVVEVNMPPPPLEASIKRI